MSSENDPPLIFPPPDDPDPAEDTQPTKPISEVQFTTGSDFSEDTQPTYPIKPVTRRHTPLAWSIVLVLAAVTQVALILAGGTAFFLSLMESGPTPTRVTVTVDGETQTVATFAETVDDLLRELNLVLQPGDILTPAPTTPLTAALEIRIRRARAVTLTVDGKPQTIRTLFDNPLDILNSAGVAVRSYDLVLVDGTQTTGANLVVWPVPANSISITRAVSVTVQDEDTTIPLITTAATIGEALFEAGITLYLGDVVTPDVNAVPEDGLTVTIARSRPVTIIADGVTVETRTQGENVGSALADAGIMLTGLDYAIPGEETAIMPGISIRVIRVKEEIITEQELIPYETIYQDDPALELDQRAIVQAGQNGATESHIRVRYENGIEINRELEETVPVREAVNQIVAYGTNIVIRTVETPEGPREYWRKFRMYATSYHPAALGGSMTTAIGEPLTKGTVGIDPTIIPYRTKLFVPGYGIGLAADTGGPRSSPYWIDLGYDDDNWVSWSRYVDVYLLTPIPENMNYLLPEFTPMRGLPDN